MAEPDTTKQKQEKAGEKIANIAHVVTPDPDKDPGLPKLGTRKVSAADIDTAPTKKKIGADTGPMHVGVNFDASDS